MIDSLSSPVDYAAFIHNLPNQYSSVEKSSLTYVPLGVKVGKVIGIVFFESNVTLCVQEFLNFELNVIEGYGYEVSRSRREVNALPKVEEYCRASYPDKDKLYWYDSFPHPNDPSLASTHPHHKHVHPNIKQNRVSAPDLTFTAPNLPFLIEEIERTVLRNTTGGSKPAAIF